MSIFNTPYIKAVQESDDSYNAEIFSKSSRCGNIHISRSGLTYSISCGLKIGKGIIDIKKVDLKYKKKKLILSSLDNIKKKLLVVECSQDIFESINRYISGVKSSEPNNKNTDFLFNN